MWLVSLKGLTKGARHRSRRDVRRHSARLLAVGDAVPGGRRGEGELALRQMALSEHSPPLPSDRRAND